MVEILRSRDQTGPLWWRFSSTIVALYSLPGIGQTGAPVIIPSELGGGEKVSERICTHNLFAQFENEQNETFINDSRATKSSCGYDYKYNCTIVKKKITRETF